MDRGPTSVVATGSSHVARWRTFGWAAVRLPVGRSFQEQALSEKGRGQPGTKASILFDAPELKPEADLAQEAEVGQIASVFLASLKGGGVASITI